MALTGATAATRAGEPDAGTEPGAACPDRRWSRGRRFPVPSDFEELGILVAILVDGRHIAGLMPLDRCGGERVNSSPARLATLGLDTSPKAARDPCP